MVFKLFVCDIYACVLRVCVPIHTCVWTDAPADRRADVCGSSCLVHLMPLTESLPVNPELTIFRLDCLASKPLGTACLYSTSLHLSLSLSPRSTSFSLFRGLFTLCTLQHTEVTSIYDHPSLLPGCCAPNSNPPVYTASTFTH